MTENDPIIWAWWGWEPLPFYLRYKKNAVGLLDPGDGELREWYRRLHDEETVKAAAGLGINCIATHYIKGFGPEHEREDVQLTAKLVKLCHKHGIRVFGYLQYGSIFYETFFQEYPEAAEWIQMDENGRPQCWCGHEYRRMPCLQSREYLDYLKERIRTGLLEVGLDGLHFDNFYSRPCYCPRCREAWRRESGEELPAGKMLETIPTPPAVRRWVKFRCETLAAHMAELRQYARSLKPDVMTIWNPSQIRGLQNQRLLRAADFFELGKNAGFLWSESGNFPRLTADGMIHHVNFVKTAAAAGYRTFLTAWKSGDEGTGLPETFEEVALSHAESCAFGADPGNNWLMRLQNIRQLPDGPLCREWKRQVDFFLAHRDLFAGSRGRGELALYYDRERAEADFVSAYRQFLALQEMLLENHFTFDLVFSGQEERFGEYPLVLGAETSRPGVMTFSREELLSGEITGAYSAAVRPPAGSRELVARIRKALPRRELEIFAPETVFAERRISSDGRNILHLVNYDNRNPVGGLRIRFATPPGDLTRYSPEGDRTLCIDGPEALLPVLRTWAVLVWAE